jgi:hypothetical protein
VTVHLWAWWATLSWGVLGWGSVLLLAWTMPTTVRTAAWRAAAVQGLFWGGREAVAAWMPPLGPWFDPIPWIDVVRVSGMWIPGETGFWGGWAWAARTTAGACLVSGLASLGMLSGPWLAYGAWREATPDLRGIPWARRLAGWIALGVGLWAVASVLSVVVDETTGHDLMRALSWGWLAWAWSLLVAAAAAPFGVLLRLGWISWPLPR